MKPKLRVTPPVAFDEAEATEFLEYIVGLSKNPPATPRMFGQEMDADRAKSFVQRFLNRHGMKIEAKAEAHHAFSVPVRSRPAPKRAGKARPRVPASWSEAVAIRVKAGDSKHVAMSTVAREYPDLYEANQDRMENQALMARNITRLKSQNEGLRRQLKARAVPIPSVPASTVPQVERLVGKRGMPVVEQPESEAERSQRKIANERRARARATQ